MAFITGLYLIHAPASALNNGEAADIEARVKSIRVSGRDYPYVSAQAMRYWLRGTLERYFSQEWAASPVYTGGKGQKQQAYTVGDPIQFADDDLLGYMRATKDETVTRVSPFRTSTLVSVGPVEIISDFGVMARMEKQEGDKEGVVLHQHQFYRTTLQGMFSLDLNAAGTFTNQLRSGYQNLGDAASTNAKLLNLSYSDAMKAYRLPIDERVRRVQILLRALGRLEGGAKQTLHYTDVRPVFVIAAVTHGGNHPFGHIIGQDRDGHPLIKAKALEQALTILQGEAYSPIYVGRVEGFMDSAQSVLDENKLSAVHPRQVFDALAADLDVNRIWMD
jgi:CRISPR-associated protein Cst2